MVFFCCFFFFGLVSDETSQLAVSFSSDLDIVCVNCIERILISRKTQLSSGEHDTFISFFLGLMKGTNHNKSRNTPFIENTQV